MYSQIESSYKSVSFLAFSVLVFILSPILSTQETAVPSMLYVVSIFLPTFFYVILVKNVLINKVHIYAVILWVMGIFSSIVSPYGTLDIRLIKYLILVIYFICVTKTAFSDKDIMFVAKWYIYTSIIVAILIIASYIFGYAHVESDYYIGRYSIGITGLYKNPNYLTSFINVAFFFWGYMLLFCRVLPFNKLVYSCLMVLFIIAFYLTGTRASLLTAGFIIVVMLIRYFREKKRFSLILIFVLLIISLLFIFKNEINELLYLFIGNRDMLSDESRTLSWAYAFSNIFERPIWGCGLFAWENLGDGSYIKYLHNVFLELFLNQGIIGVVLLLLLLFSGYSKTKKQDRFFILLFMFVSGFPLFFQNGLIDVNFMRFIILNRIIFMYSSFSEKGIVDLIGDKKADI